MGRQVDVMEVSSFLRTIAHRKILDIVSNYEHLSTSGRPTRQEMAKQAYSTQKSVFYHLQWVAKTRETTDVEHLYET